MTARKLKQQAGVAGVAGVAGGEEPAAKPPSRRADGSANIAIMHEVWRQAYLAEEPFRLPCGSVKEANSMRVKLYNAVRNVKKFPEDYPGMVAPVSDVEIVKDLQDESVLILRRKELSPQMLELRRLLEGRGVVIADSALRGTPQTREIAASMDRLLEQMTREGAEVEVASPEPAPHPSPQPAIRNPFYTREQQ